ncbi:MAG: hypothetical protein GF411_03995 [Candidatus Lokiarchaeota archaeon]|nr:hypothetical protein [Candidatus Lokiarchaeota archaeon]
MKIEKVENMRYYVQETVTRFIDKHFPERSEEMNADFEEKFSELQQSYESEVEGLQKLMKSINPAVSSVLGMCEEYDILMAMIVSLFKATWEGAQRRKKKPPPRPKLVLPGSDQSIDLSFHCSACRQEIEVSYEDKMRILNSDGDVPLPVHCGEQAKLKITKADEELAEVEETKPDDQTIPVEMVIGYIPSDEVEYRTVLSVGIDIGSSTSHLIFSRLTLKRETGFLNMTNRFNLIGREIIYKSEIIFTPLIDKYTIDVDAVVKFCEEEYQKAGIRPEMVETGAVLVTGETAKKQNAAEIVKRLSSESGKFVSAAAGPNLESMLSAMGSGVVNQSLLLGQTILHIDIGGGTSNMSIVSSGKVLTTACINVGGRLLGIDKDYKIWRIDGPTQFVMQKLGMQYAIGDTISEEDAMSISTAYAEALLEVMQGKATNVIAKELLMTSDLDFSVPIDAYSFSGGVGELIYGGDETFDDIGLMLANDIKRLLHEQELRVIEPPAKIRATVIGAGAFSLSVSGSTTFVDNRIEFPLKDIPVLPINLDENFSPEQVVESIQRAYSTFDKIEGSDVVGLYFEQRMRSTEFSADEILVEFAKAIERALPVSVRDEKLIILLLSYDVGKLLGIAIRDHTSIKGNFMCLDELKLEAGDWIDIGTPIGDAESTFPVTVKSLVFNENKEYE